MFTAHQDAAAHSMGSAEIILRGKFGEMSGGIFNRNLGAVLLRTLEKSFEGFLKQYLVGFLK